MSGFLRSKKRSGCDVDDHNVRVKIKSEVIGIHDKPGRILIYQGKKLVKTVIVKLNPGCESVYTSGPSVYISEK